MRILIYNDCGTEKFLNVFFPVDASNNCIGTCFTPKANEDEEKPIYYISQTQSPTQKRWSTVEMEGYAIYYALQKLDHYLHNAIFTVKTNYHTSTDFSLYIS